ncbi:hypothetical protein AMAG_11563 [Allomyces macrogynus ATCC 38327]|uniref:SPRY domain-containing protein n=1 Tax=Allomyces macrogynus (strain ATCC 38327) TaxID=578462 RepID=A0A0L0SVL2_ALLM3|nr:hypothetical protein AMAG_11563 [Allomyces macrogynus ATCC 38327]|eukprot:KNE66425.1 hypothetical protein AMAG_11563 [Allomyces macrogynus ATCC 38327]
MADTWNVEIEDDWDFATYGAPSHPIVGPSGAKGYWDHDSITAGAYAPPGPLHNCTFVTLSPSGTINGTTMYFDETCPKIPWAHRLGSRILFWVVISFVAIGFCQDPLIWIGYGLAMRVKRVFKPLMPLFKAVRNAWNSFMARVRPDESRKVADGPAENTSWTPAVAVTLDNATPLIDFDVLPDQASKVCVVHGASASRIKFFPHDGNLPSPSNSSPSSLVPPQGVAEQGPGGSTDCNAVTVLTKLPFSRATSSPGTAPSVMYLEVAIAAALPSTTISIGLARPPHPSDQLSGNVSGSIGYSSVGKITQDGWTMPSSAPWPTYGVGDVVGVGIDARFNVYLTHNGTWVAFLMLAPTTVPEIRLAIGAAGPCVVEVRWRGPWMWEEARVKGYRYLPAHSAGVGEEASLEPRKDGVDAPTRTDGEEGVASAHS